MSKGDEEVPEQFDGKLLSESSEILIDEKDKSKKKRRSIVRKKYELTHDLEKQLENLPDIMEFIRLLQKYIHTQERKIRKIRLKLKKPEVDDAGTQTEDVLQVLKMYSENENESTTFKDFTKDIKAAAELATQKSGFVYEETSGMYYDYNTGYYYNAEYGLYYDASSGIYMTYNSETGCYEYYSQTSTPPVQQYSSQPCAYPQDKRPSKTPDTEDVKTSATDVEHLAPKRRCLRNSDDDEAQEASPEENNDEIEEGECVSVSSGDDEDVQIVEDEDKDQGVADDDIELSKQLPCMRLIVEDSTVPSVKVGSLHLITIEGGSLGREGAEHAILLRDVNVSKHHLRFAFDREAGRYTVRDMGSRNGTLLNGRRMAASKVESEAEEVAHGSRIQLGGVIFLCHVHEGGRTCGHCEPGLLQQTSSSEIQPIAPKVTKSQKYKRELKNLKKMYAISYDNTEAKDAKLAAGYQDRAQKRREVVGSINPHEKTQMASLDETIPKENKGFKLLSKMGWKEGQSLGKQGQGIAEPIQVISNSGTAGIGSVQPEIEPVNSSKSKLWKKTQARFEKLPETHTTKDADVDYPDTDTE